ncbi:MAG: hypothetical protein KKH73_07545 [Actinobacteria bacterium]|nr:hypothetical protein [Actinomycetota bacterium]
MHLEENEALIAARKLITATKVDGIIFVSVKEGSGESKDKDGRYFRYFNLINITSLFNLSKAKIIGRPWITTTPNTQTSWVNILLKRLK